MINKSLHRQAGGEYEEDPTLASPSSQLSAGPPPAPLRSDPDEDNSLAMLGTSPMDEMGGAVMPSEGGPMGLALGSLGMVIQGLQGLSTVVPGFVPAEVTMWTQQAMQMLPQLLQQMQSSLSSGVPGMAMGMSQTGALGGMPPPAAAQPQPSGPPQMMM